MTRAVCSASTGAKPQTRSCEGVCAGSRLGGRTRRASSRWSLVEAARQPPPPASYFVAWIFCSTCKQRFTGQVRLLLAIAPWTKHSRAVETDGQRIGAAASYAAALDDAGGGAEAARLQRRSLDVETRMFGPEHHEMLTSASNLAASLIGLGE